MNQDDAPDYLSEQEYTKAHNYRSTGSDEGEAGHGTNIESTQLITPSDQRPTGLSSNIGSGTFKNIRKTYSIYYNSTGRHQITEFDPDTLIETVIFEDLTDTGGIQLFNILPTHYFNDVKLFHNNYLILADGISGIVYCINLERLKSGGYGATITQEDFNLLKNQPLIPIKVAYVDDPTKNANLLKGKLFQFRPQFGYFDEMKSSWGTMSKRAIPELELTDAVGDDPTKANGILARVNIGNDRVKNITVAVREYLYNWRICKEVTREYILALPASIDLDNLVREAYDPTTNEYSFIFYNDGAYEAVDPLDTDESYDNIPDNVGAIEVINGDILALGDLDEGYERPTGLTVDISVSTYAVDLGGTVEADTRKFDINVIQQYNIEDKTRVQVILDTDGTFVAGDQIYINMGFWYSPNITQTIQYTVVTGDDMTSVINNLYNLAPNNTAFNGALHKEKQVNNIYYGYIVYITDPQVEVKNAFVIKAGTGDAEGRTVNAVKSNTSYQFALAHYKTSGKYYPIVTGDNYVANTPSYAVSEGLIPQIGWNISGTPPEGATSAQWLVSENTKYQSNLYITGAYDPEESKDDFIAINLGSLNRYKEASESGVVAYDYTEGDRVTFIHNFDGDETPIKWFNNPPLDFAIVGFEIKSETVSGVQTTKNLLRIKKSSLINIPADLNGKEFLLELYTPKRNNESLETKVFYEIGEQINIVNGQYETTSGVFTGLDSYLKPRKFISNDPTSDDVFVFPVEDFNFSDDYISNVWSNGRGRTYNDEVGKVKRGASIRYSEPSSIGSLDNNINRFYANRIYGDSPAETTSIYGRIVKMIMRDNILIVLQELKDAHIPVNNTIITSQDEQEQLAISDKLFNNVRYLPSNYGAGLAKRAITVSNSGNVYFVDPNNGLPLRDGYDGLRVINSKMVKYFIKKLKGIDPNSIVSWFDEFNNEWNITYLDLTGEIKSFTFDETNYEFKDSYILGVGDVTLVQPDNGTLTVDGANLVYTPDTDYNGTDSFGITFLDGVTIMYKNGCMVVQPAVTSLNDFSFIALINQELSTVLISNSIFVTGNNVPVPISIVGGEYRINDGTWTSVSGTVAPNAKVEVRQTSSASYLTTTTTTLTISDQSGDFAVTTKEEADVTPFSFSPVNNANLGSLYTSNSITVAGVTAPQNISIVNGEYRINGAGSWLTTPSTINNGSTVQVRRVSSSSYSTAVSTTLTIGGTSGTFTITTKSSPVPSIVAVKLGGDITTVCETTIDTYYYDSSLGVFGTGAILYTSSSLSTPVMGYQYVVDAGSGTKYEMNFTTGELLSSVGTC